MSTKGKTTKVYLHGLFVGGKVLPQKANYLKLMALYRNTTVQDLLDAAIDLLVKSNPVSKDQMIASVSARARLEWEQIRQSLSKSELKEHREKYKRKFHDTLLRRSIDTKTIKLIMQAFRKGYYDETD